MAFRGRKDTASVYQIAENRPTSIRPLVHTIRANGKLPAELVTRQLSERRPANARPSHRRRAETAQGGQVRERSFCDAHGVTPFGRVTCIARASNCRLGVQNLRFMRRPPALASGGLGLPRRRRKPVRCQVGPSSRRLPAEVPCQVSGQPPLTLKWGPLASAAFGSHFREVATRRALCRHLLRGW